MCRYITWTCRGVPGRDFHHLKRLSITKACPNVGSCNFVNDISLRDAEKFNETCGECKEMKKQNAERAKERATAKKNVKGKEKVTAKESGGLHSSGQSTPSKEKVTAKQSGGLHSSGHRR